MSRDPKKKPPQTPPEDALAPPDTTSETPSAVRLKRPLEPVPPRLCDPAFVWRIPLTTWSEILAASGEAPGGLTHDAILEFLRDGASPLLIDALDTIQVLDDDDTVENLQRLEKRLGRVLPDSWSPDAPVIEQIAKLWLAGQEDGEVMNRLAIARTSRLKRASPRRMFWGEAKMAVWNDPCEEEFQVRLLQAFGERGLGRYAEIIRHRLGHTLTLYIIRAKRPRSIVCVDDDDTGRTTMNVKEAVCDILIYEGSIGRLEVRASRNWLAELYRDEFADAAFGDRSFFGLPGAFSLEPFQKKGSAVLTMFSGAPDIVAAELRELVHHPRPGQRRTYYSDSDDLLDSLASESVSLTRGKIVEARIAFKFDGLIGRRRTTVKIKPPYDWDCRDEYREVVMAFLQHAGLFSPTDQNRPTLWSLGGTPHPSDEWSHAVGCEPGIAEQLSFMRRVTNGNGASAASKTWTVSDEGLLEWPDPATAAFVLDEAALARALAADFGLQGRPVDVPVRAGIRDIGAREIGTRTLRFYLACGEPDRAPAELERLLHVPTSEEPVLLVPPGCEWPDAGRIRTLTLSKLVPPLHLREVVVGLGLEAELPAVEWAPEGRRLVFDRDVRMVWLDGVELDLNPADYEFALQVAENTLKGRTTPNGATFIPDEMKTKKKNVKKALERVLTAAGQPRGSSKKILDTSKGRGYEYKILPWVSPRVTER
ncbi:MAG: hypothetical protein RLP09_18530 [Sandaracinaceae bacterium]